MGAFQGQQHPPGGSASQRPLPQIPACDCVSGGGQHSAPKVSTSHAQSSFPLAPESRLSSRAVVLAGAEGCRGRALIPLPREN